MKTIQRSNLIIELTGAPCSGKSYLIDSLKTRFSESDDVVFFTDNIIFSAFSKRGGGENINILVQNFLFLLYSLVSVKSMLSVIRLSAKAILLDMGLLNKLNLIRNLVLKFGRFNYVDIHFKEKIIFFDEGISHIPFNFLVTNNTELLKIMEINDWAANRLTVLIVDSRGVDTYSRIQKRGHRKILGMTNSEVARFVKLNDDVLSLLVLKYKERLYKMVEMSVEDISDCILVDELVRKFHA